MQLNIKNNTLKVIVRPNSPKNEIICYDKARDAYKVNIKAKPEQNRANIETTEFHSSIDEWFCVLKNHFVEF